MVIRRRKHWGLKWYAKYFAGLAIYWLLLELILPDESTGSTWVDALLGIALGTAYMVAYVALFGREKPPKTKPILYNEDHPDWRKT